MYPKLFLLELVIAASLLVASGGAVVLQEPMMLCAPDHAMPELRCTCLTQHPGWCDDDIPPPYCCKVGEGKTMGCGCCRATQSTRWVGKPCTHGG